MEWDWNAPIEQIRANDRIDKRSREQFVESIAVLRRELGDRWPENTNHPLLWRMRHMHGNPDDWFISLLVDNITALKAVAGIQSIMDRIRTADQYDGAIAEIEVGGTLARNGCRLTIGPKRGKKRPDFFCEKDGCGFLVEVKTLRISEERQRADRTLWRIITACNPIFPTGVILKSLSKPHLEEIECALREAAGRVTVETPQEIDIRNVLKFYLVHPDDPDRIRKDNEWCREQERLGIYHACGGVFGPPEDSTDLFRVRSRIIGIKREKQIPKDEMGILFILGSFFIRDVDVERFVDGIVEEVYELVNIPAVVFVGTKVTTLSQETPKIIEKKDYIDIGCCLAPYLTERVLIVKNRFCRFPFDYGILKAMYQ